MSNHKSHEQLHEEINLAREEVIEGKVYQHFKNPDSKYLVLCLACDEGSDELCVIYQSVLDPELKFIRPVSSWVEEVEWDGRTVKRFSLVKE